MSTTDYAPDLCEGCGRPLTDNDPAGEWCATCARVLNFGAPEPEPQPVAEAVAGPKLVSAERWAQLRGEAPAAATPAAPEPAASPEPAGDVLVFASAVKSKRVRWLWRGYDPLGYLTISTGESKLGKTTFAALKLARLTRGELPGEFEGKPQPVVVIAAEDGLGDLWKPRLVAAGADLDRVAFIKIPDGWNIRDGVGLIDRALEQLPAPLVFIDSVMEHLPEAHGSENANAATFIRQTLRPAARLAEARGVSIGISTHPPKGRAQSFADAYHGSGAFTQVSRSCLLFGWHPDDRELPEDQRRRVMLRAAGNIGRNPGAITFRIGGQQVDLDDGSRDEVGYAYDTQACNLTARDLLNADRVGGSLGSGEAVTASKVDQLAERIRAYLADGGWHPSIRAELQEEGHASGTIAEAVKRVAYARKTPGTMNGSWQWRLDSSKSVDRSTDRSASRARSLSPQPDRSTDQGLNPSVYGIVEVSGEFDEGTAPEIRCNDVSESDGGYARAREADAHLHVVAGREPEEPLTDSQRARLAEPGRKIGYLNLCHCADGGAGEDDARCSRCWGWRAEE